MLTIIIQNLCNRFLNWKALPGHNEKNSRNKKKNLQWDSGAAPGFPVGGGADPP